MNRTDKGFRTENKYIITEDIIEALYTQLCEMMYPDSNMKDNQYLVRSLYFDDYTDSCLDEVENGLREKEKFRIRTYNGDDRLIKLELKKKLDGKTKKLVCAISSKEVRDILRNDLELSGESEELIKRLWTEQKTRLLHPVNIVEYERMALTDPIGNVRITFDKNIGASNRIERFFEKNIYAIPIMPKGQHILEVKYDEFLPEYIKRILDSWSFQRTSYSKYYNSRRGRV